jgi:hypothetical protein
MVIIVDITVHKWKQMKNWFRGGLKIRTVFKCVYLYNIDITNTPPGVNMHTKTKPSKPLKK